MLTFMEVVDLYRKRYSRSDHAGIIPLRHAICRRCHQRSDRLPNDVRLPAGNAHDRHHCPGCAYDGLVDGW